MKDLTVKEVAALRNPGKHRVSRNLYLQIEGRSRSWLFRYERHGTAHWHGLGSYDLVSLAEARDKAIDRRKILLEGSDPIEQSRAQRQQVLLDAASTVTFRECAEAYMQAHDAGWRSDRHRHQWRHSLESYVYPAIGQLPVAAVDVPHIMKILEPIWQEKPETASRVLDRIRVVLDWATARRYRSGDNPARWRGHISQLLPKKTKLAPVQHMAAMPYVELPAFMPRLQERDGIDARALELTILTAARTAETLEANWAEVDFAARTWSIPPTRIKSARSHTVPLPDRALEILRELPREAGNPLIFPGARGGRPLSPSAMLRVLRDLDAPYTTHGFRSSFRDWCAEQTNFPRELAEAALAHVVKDKTEASYQRGSLLEKRRRLMDAWARYCSAPRAPGAVVPMARTG